MGDAGPVPCIENGEFNLLRIPPIFLAEVFCESI